MLSGLTNSFDRDSFLSSDLTKVELMLLVLFSSKINTYLPTGLCSSFNRALVTSTPTSYGMLPILDPSIKKLGENIVPLLEMGV
jgi:hypothetical protein